MSVVVASSHLQDDQFVNAFRSCDLPATNFRHGDHLRLAWIYLHSFTAAEAEQLFKQDLKRYATHLGAHGLYHETITLAWLKLLATHTEPTFAEFLQLHEEKLGVELLLRFWSRDVLMSDAARAHWIAPDQRALPQ